MKRFDLSRQPDASQLAQRVASLQEQLRSLQEAVGAEALAVRSGCEFHPETPKQGRLTLGLWQKFVHMLYPGWYAIDPQTSQALPVVDQALLLYYFITADGKQPEKHWVSFSDLPDGRFYNQAFQGYSGGELARAFQNNLEAFERAASSLGGTLAPKEPQIPGDRAVIFRALPRVAVLAAYWQGDEDFSAAAQILFDVTVPHYLPTDVCAILGSTLTRRLIKQMRQGS